MVQLDSGLQFVENRVKDLLGEPQSGSLRQLCQPLEQRKGVELPRANVRRKPDYVEVRMPE